jgi:hypothetical protein
MYRISTLLAVRLRTALRQPDRGEFGPMAYVVMVSAMVLLAVAVVAWGERIADAFMDNVDEGW